MADLIIECENVINELSKFSGGLCLLGNPIKDDRLEAFEIRIGCNLPTDFKFILKKYNKFSLGGTEVFGIGEEFKGSSLDKVYDFEHDAVENRMPKEFLPFSPDGRGNHYCMDLGRLSSQVCPVIFWQSDFKYDKISDAETCNDSFTSWVREVMIDWTLQNYNYDGSPK